MINFLLIFVIFFLKIFYRNRKEAGRDLRYVVSKAPLTDIMIEETMMKAILVEEMTMVGKEDREVDMVTMIALVIIESSVAMLEEVEVQDINKETKVIMVHY